MRRTIARRFFALLPMLFCAELVVAQVTTGTPPFGSFGGGPFDTLNLASLNVHFAVPIHHRAGRGTDFNYSLSYDNSVWYPVGASGSQTWTPVANWGWRGVTEANTGYVSYATISEFCFIDTTRVLGTTYRNWVYHDPAGTTHFFPTIAFNSCDPGPVTGTTNDGSGYTMTASPNLATINPVFGGTITPPLQSLTGTGSVTDRNGNVLSATLASGTTTFTDTLGTPVLTVSGSGTPASPMQYSYTSPANTAANVLVHYTNKNVRTNFGCSGISETSTPNVPMVTDVTLPDGSQYTFQYEATPGTTTGEVTGRITLVTLPTGGQIQYQYTGGSNGVICADGSGAGMTRTLTPGGAWTYARDNSSGHWITTISDPAIAPNPSNQTVIDFQGIYETQRKVYQGATTGTILATSITCYNATGTPIQANCPTSAVTLPISRKTVFSYLPDANGVQSERDSSYNSFGLPSAVSEYDFGVLHGAAGPLTRTTTTSYATLGNNIVDRPAIISVNDGGGNLQARTTYSYDETAVTATSGTPQHVAVSGSRGNVTTIATQTSSNVISLYRTFTYYDTGTPHTSTDVSNTQSPAGAQTTYNYGTTTASCGNSFVTSISEPLGLSRSMTWNCTGGVITSTTDENGKVASVSYTDPFFWRPHSVSDQLTPPNVTTLTYTGATVVESNLPFNGTTSVSDVRTTIDALGRPLLNQIKQGPSATNFDSTQTNYDVVGRISKSLLPFVTTAGTQCSGTCPGTTTTYDALGRARTITDAGGGTVTLTYINNTVYQSIGPATTLPAAEATKDKQFQFDGLGRLISVCEITTAADGGLCNQAVNKTGYWTKYTYDVLNNLLSVTQNAQSTGSQQTRSYTRDRLGRITSETNPESGLVTYNYDNMPAACGSALAYPGDMTMKTDAAGNKTCYYYDALHRMYQAGFAGPVCRRFWFDLSFPSLPTGITVANTKGRLEGVSTDDCVASQITAEFFSYDANGRLTDVYQSTPHSGTTYYHTTASYFANGAINTLGGVPGQGTWTFNIDGEGRPKTAVQGTTNLVTNTTYNTASQPLNVTLGLGDTDAYQYDSLGRMTQYKFTVGATPTSVTGNLTWNANGTLRKLDITDGFNGTNTQVCNYKHDDLARTSSVDCGTPWSQTFSFDPFGNIKKTGSAQFLPNYSLTTNQFTSIPGVTVSYDGNGNLLTDNAHTYTWDQNWGNPATVDAVGLTYDALGRVVEQNRAGVFTQILYSPVGKIALMNGQTFKSVTVPLPGGDTIVYLPGSQRFQHRDWLGTSRFASTRATRAFYYSGAYGPYGENYAGSGTTDLSFTGQNQDTVSGLYDFMFREYSNVGRWVSPDPAGSAAASPGNPQSWNRYAYVSNYPLRAIDLFGLRWVDACTTAGGDTECSTVWEDDPEPEPPVLPGGGAVDGTRGGGGAGSGNGGFQPRNFTVLIRIASSAGCSELFEGGLRRAVPILEATNYINVDSIPQVSAEQSFKELLAPGSRYAAFTVSRFSLASTGAPFDIMARTYLSGNFDQIPPDYQSSLLVHELRHATGHGREIDPLGDFNQEISNIDSACPNTGAGTHD